jgi:hypothetical protein
MICSGAIQAKFASRFASPHQRPKGQHGGDAGQYEARFYRVMLNRYEQCSGD